MSMRKDIVDLSKTGIKFDIPEKDGEGITAYNATGNAVALGDVLVLTYGYTAGTEVNVTIPATNTSLYQYIVVALEAVSDAAIGRFQMSGYCEAFVEGTTDVAAGDFLEVLNANNEFKKDGTSRTVNSVARAVEAQAENENVLVTVFLLGERVNIAAS